MTNRMVAAAAVAAVLAAAQTSPPKKPKKQVSWLVSLQRFLGISATPAGLKGEDEADPQPGDIWVTGLSGGDTPRPLTSDGGYRSPIFGGGGKAILALKGAGLVEISLSGGGVRSLPAPPNLSKLVARESGPPGRILALTADDRGGLFAPSSVEMEGGSIEDRALLRRLKNWTRVYDGLTLFVKPRGPNVRNGWTDIFVQQGSAQPVEISHCLGDFCSQPSLSEDRRQVVFIRTAK
ncbi:MAG TPA: hypothetical protein VIX89_08040 [Bryobacteraceae bacterium]